MPEGPQVYAPTSDKKPPPRGRTMTRAPPQPSAVSARRPAAIKPRDPDRGSHLRSRAAGPSAACSPSGCLPQPAQPRAPRRALAAHPLCDRQKLAAGAAWLPKENRAECPPGHPRPPISGGDSSRAGSPGTPLNRGGLRPLSRRSAGPARLARGRPRPQLRRDPLSPCPSSFSPLSVQRSDPHPCSCNQRGDPGKGPTAPWRPSVPAGVADSAPSGSSCLVQATASPAPKLCGSPGSSAAERKPSVSALYREPAWGRRSSKVTRARIKKSNHFASCRSHPPQSAAGRPAGSRCQPGSAPRSGPQEAPAQPDPAALFPGTVTADRAPGRSPRGPASTFLEKFPSHLASLAAPAPTSVRSLHSRETLSEGSS